MNIRIRLMWSIVLIWGIISVSCSGRKIPVTITQHTDITHITGIVPYQDAVFCATKGGLVKWELPEAKYSVFTTIDGLSSNILSDVVVDGDGTLWIGSVDGISSFNGSVFKNYGLTQGLPSAEIKDLAVDGKGKLWAATTSGVASYERGRFKLLDEEGSPGNASSMCVYFDMGDNIWIGTENDGIYFKTEGKWQRATTKNGLPVNTIDAIVQAWDRSVWSASWAGIARWDGIGWQLFSSTKRIGTYEARQLISTDKRLWYFTSNGVHASQGNDWFHFTENEGLISNDVTCGYIVTDDKVYVGTIDGMSVIENGTIENYFIPNSPVGYNCISITIDDRSRIWLGTWETGLNMYDSGYWTQLIGRSEKMLETVRSIVFGPDKEIVFNTTNGIVFENRNNWVIETRQEGISGNDVRCGVYDSEGRYWIGTSSGICYRENGKWKRFRGIHGLPSEDTWVCALGKDGTLWFGTTKGIVSFNNKEMADRTQEIGLGEIDVRSIAVDGNRILFGTENGKLIEYENGSWDVYSSNYINTTRGIYAITIDPLGRMWFGTDGDGIICLVNGKKTQYTISDGLPSNYIRSLAFGNNTLWAACYGGVVSIEIKKGEK